MGVSGSGKTTFGRALASKLQVSFYDADDYHLDTSIAKMSQGIALGDQDRQPWLHKLNLLLRQKAMQGSAVLACSALREKHRGTLLEGLIGKCWIIFLKGDKELVRDRINTRPNHFMPVALLESQFKELEEPCNALVLDITQNTERLLTEVLAQVASDKNR